MAKQKVRFCQISVGESFEWAGKEYTKIADRRALSLNPRMESIFGTTDTVRILVHDEDEDDYFYPAYGIIGSGQKTPSFGTPSQPFAQGSRSTQGTMSADDLEDAYGVDTCNFNR